MATKTDETEKVVEAYRRMGVLADSAGNRAAALRYYASVIEVGGRAALWDDVAEAYLARATLLAAMKRPGPAAGEWAKAEELKDKVQDPELKRKLGGAAGTPAPADAAGAAG